MNRDFYDTSSFAKLFLKETDSELVLQRFRTVSEVVISWLTLVEMRSAVQKLVLRRIISQGEADAIHRTIDRTVNEVIVVPLLESEFRHAEELVRSRNLRALDALQLASALSAAANGDVTFVVSDTKLREAALAEELSDLYPA